MGHCEDLQADRDLGARWERNFCELAGRHGRCFTAHQIGRTKSAQAIRRLNGNWHPLTLPDITIWSAPGEHHEVKHKDPAKTGARKGCFGLEVYRLEALLAFQEEIGGNQHVYYTIHRHDWAGGRNAKINKIEHWVTVYIGYLKLLIDREEVYRDWTDTWCRGEKKCVPTWYWRASAWKPLQELWIEKLIGKTA